MSHGLFTAIRSGIRTATGDTTVALAAAAAAFYLSTTNGYSCICCGDSDAGRVGRQVDAICFYDSLGRSSACFLSHSLDRYCFIFINLI